MAKTTQKLRPAQARVAAKQPVEKDSVYLLKLIMYMIIGAFYLRFQYQNKIIPIPLGLIVGMAFVMHEHFQIDRKVEIAILVVMAGISLFAGGYGLTIYN